MKSILVTGGTSFIGRNVIPCLRQHYTVISPSRETLDVTSQTSVDTYLAEHRFDILIHLAAGRRGGEGGDSTNEESRASEIIRSFLYFEQKKEYFEKILYIGSGAEFDQSRSIKNIRENEIGGRIPGAPYAFAKYILNKIAAGSQNIYNLRVFGCYGPFEDENRFIRHAIDCCIKDAPVTIRQDCYFDYIYAGDLAEVMRWFIEHTPHYHDYNITAGKPMLLSSIAEIVMREMNNTRGIELLKTGLANEYTGNNERLFSEMGGFQFTTLSAGIKEEIRSIYG